MKDLLGFLKKWRHLSFFGWHWLAIQCLQWGALRLSLDSWHSLWNASPLLGTDYSVLYYWTERGVQFFQSTGKLWGYDPFYAAGIPLNFVWNSGLPTQSIAALTHPWISSALVIKAFLATGLFLFPWICFQICRNWGLSSTESIYGMWLGVLSSWLGIHFFMLQLGMLPAYIASFWAVFSLSWFVKHSTRLPVLKATFLLASNLWLHKTTAVILGPPLLLLWCFQPFKQKLQWGGSAFGALGANLIWILPAWPVLAYRQDQNQYDWLSLSHLLDVLHLPGVQSVWGHVAFSGVLCFLGFIGLQNMRKSSSTISAISTVVLWCSCLYYGGMSYLGLFWEPLHLLGPYRYVIPLQLCLMVPAAKLVCLWLNPKPAWMPASLLLGGLLLPGFQYIGVSIPKRSQPPEVQRHLESWLQKHTSLNGRVLLEDVNYRMPNSRQAPYQVNNLSSTIAVSNQRFFIGGPYSQHHLKHHFASFQNAHLFGKSWVEFSEDELRLVLTAYNIHWVVAWSAESIGFLKQHPDFELAPEQPHPDLTAFVYQHPASYFIQGSGQIKMDLHTVELQQIQSENGSVVLSLHHTSLIQTDPPTEIQSYMLGNDPIGFVEILDPPETLTLILSGH